MMKLLTLRSSSSFAADALYRIQSRMEPYGLYADNTSVYGTTDELVDAAVMAVEDGLDIIVAVEKEQYSSIKHTIAGRLMLEEDLNADIAEAVSLLLGSEYTVEPIDLTEQSLLPKDSEVLLSNDGLYSGFCWTSHSDSRLWFMALDYSRVDSVIDELIGKYFEQPESTEPVPVVVHDRKSVDYDFSPAVTKLVYSLVQLDKRVAISESESVELIKPLTDTVQSFGEVTYFVRDENAELHDNEEPQACAVRRAREALTKTYADFGGAVSDLVMTETDDRNIYSAFIAVVDKDGAQVKKITTDKPEDIDLLLPHAVTLLIETLCRKADIIANEGINSRPADVDGFDDDDDEDQPKKINMSMLIVAILVGIIAVGSAVGFAVSYASGRQTTTAATISPNTYYSTSTMQSSDTTFDITLPGFVTDVNATTGGAVTLDSGMTTDPNYSNPAEPAASNVAAATTTTTVSSTSGTFTFYVFGYGHGVGLSQRGAEYCASTYGWTYDQILANYYYGTTLVIGDTCPETINYAGTDYKTRDFLASALETEIGSSFKIEAMKAQAVALYTYAKYYDFKVSTTGCSYGNKPSDKAYEAVDAVMGQYLEYNGRTALTPFHAISAGKTASYYNVWGGTAISYLQGGRPSYGDYEAPDFATTYSLSSDSLKTLVKSRVSIDLTGDPATWIKILGHDACIDANTGYVSSISVGGEIYSGYKFRTDVMGGVIRSHCFKLVYTPDITSVVPAQ